MNILNINKLAAGVRSIIGIKCPDKWDAVVGASGACMMFRGASQLIYGAQTLNVSSIGHVIQEIRKASGDQNVVKQKLEKAFDKHKIGDDSIVFSLPAKWTQTVCPGYIKGIDLIAPTTNGALFGTPQFYSRNIKTAAEANKYVEMLGGRESKTNPVISVDFLTLSSQDKTLGDVDVSGWNRAKGADYGESLKLSSNAVVDTNPYVITPAGDNFQDRVRMDPKLVDAVGTGVQEGDSKLAADTRLTLNEPMKQTRVMLGTITTARPVDPDNLTGVSMLNGKYLETSTVRTGLSGSAETRTVKEIRGITPAHVGYKPLPETPAKLDFTGRYEHTLNALDIGTVTYKSDARGVSYNKDVGIPSNAVLPNGKQDESKKVRGMTPIVSESGAVHDTDVLSGLHQLKYESVKTADARNLPVCSSSDPNLLDTVGKTQIENICGLQNLNVRKAPETALKFSGNQAGLKSKTLSVKNRQDGKNKLDFDVIADGSMYHVFGPTKYRDLSSEKLKELIQDASNGFEPSQVKDITDGLAEGKYPIEDLKFTKITRERAPNKVAMYSKGKTKPMVVVETGAAYVDSAHNEMTAATARSDSKSVEVAFSHGKDRQGSLFPTTNSLKTILDSKGANVQQCSKLRADDTDSTLRKTCDTLKYHTDVAPKEVLVTSLHGHDRRQAIPVVHKMNDSVSLNNYAFGGDLNVSYAPVLYTGKDDNARNTVELANKHIISVPVGHNNGAITLSKDSFKEGQKNLVSRYDAPRLVAKLGNGDTAKTAADALKANLDLRTQSSTTPVADRKLLQMLGLDRYGAQIADEEPVDVTDRALHEQAISWAGQIRTLSHVVTHQVDGNDEIRGIVVRIPGLGDAINKQNTDSYYLSAGAHEKVLLANSDTAAALVESAPTMELISNKLKETYKLEDKHMFMTTVSTPVVSTDAHLSARFDATSAPTAEENRKYAAFFSDLTKGFTNEFCTTEIDSEKGVINYKLKAGSTVKDAVKALYGTLAGLDMNTGETFWSRLSFSAPGVTGVGFFEEINRGINELKTELATTDGHIPGGGDNRGRIARLFDTLMSPLRAGFDSSSHYGYAILQVISGGYMVKHALTDKTSTAAPCTHSHAETVPTIAIEGLSEVTPTDNPTGELATAFQAQTPIAPEPQVSVSVVAPSPTLFKRSKDSIAGGMRTVTGINFLNRRKAFQRRPYLLMAAKTVSTATSAALAATSVGAAAMVLAPKTALGLYSAKAYASIAQIISSLINSKGRKR